MKKVLLAVGHIGLEQYIKEAFKEDENYSFVGESVHRENILNLIKSTSPDILVIRETLPGKTNIVTLIYAIRSHFSEVRIVFLAGERDAGDELLASLVNCGVYDILHSGNILVDDIINLMQNPNKYQDVKHLQPIPDIEEISNEIEFVVPKEKNKEKSKTKIVNGDYKDNLEDNYEDELPSSNEEEESNQEKEVKGTDLLSDEHRKRRIKEKKEEEKEENREEEKKENVKQVDVKVRKERRRKTERIVIEEDEEDNFKQERQDKPLFNFPKINNPFSKVKNEEGEEKAEIEKKKEKRISKTEKVITFWGSKGGVGTSTIAHNMAVSLASEGNRVIYLETDKRKPSVSYWYDLGYPTEGIDTFLTYLDNKEYKHIKQTIVQSRNLMCEDEKYKVFPETLDFLFFSKECLSKGNKVENFHSLRDVYMYLLYQCNYDFVIIDLSNDVSERDLVEVLMYSNLVFTVVSQDVSSLGYHMLDMDNLRKSSIDISEKNHYILNKFTDSGLSVKDVKKWIEVDDLTLINDSRAACIDSTLNSVPVIANSKYKKHLRKEINELKKRI